jgi:hypothetical protein
MSIMRLTSIAGAVILATIGTNAAQAKGPNANATANGSIAITGIQFPAGGLVVNPVTGILEGTGGTVVGTLAGLPFTADITKFALQPLPNGKGKRCTVLDLALGPINLELLGLHVDTSMICLNITAFEGKGLLGDLLCGLAGATNPLNLLNAPTLLDGLTSILNEALGKARPAKGGGSVCSGECEILDLVVGPLKLNLLGRRVVLDDCNGGPVEVCVSATASEDLLGELLCSLSGPLLSRLTLQDIAALVKPLTK